MLMHTQPKKSYPYDEMRSILSNSKKYKSKIVTFKNIENIHIVNPINLSLSLW